MTALTRIHVCTRIHTLTRIHTRIHRHQYVRSRDTRRRLAQVGLVQSFHCATRLLLLIGLQTGNAGTSEKPKKQRAETPSTPLVASGDIAPALLPPLSATLAGSRRFVVRIQSEVGERWYPNVTHARAHTRGGSTTTMAALLTRRQLLCRAGLGEYRVRA